MNLFDENTGKGLKINNNNQAETNAVVQSEMSFISSEKGDAYTIYGRRNFAAALTDENILFLKYTGSRKLKIAAITVSTNSADGKAEMFWDATYTSGGTLIAIDSYMHNQDRSSGNSLDVLAYHGLTDLVVTTTAVKEVMDIRAAKETYHHKFEGVKMVKNSAFAIKGSVGVIGEVIRVMIECFEVD